MSEKPVRPAERTGASPEAIMSHYDMGNDFFRLVLDPEMIYSCALFKGNEDLTTAQRHKARPSYRGGRRGEHGTRSRHRLRLGRDAPASG
jgi:cyclopropane fatty-acyl-phospholipid synthase-like methyltransferase